MTIRDRAGERYGRLVALAPVGSHPRYGLMWECLCDCGRTVTVRGASLGQNTRSCGCLFVERAVEMGRTNRLDVVSYSGAHRRVRRERGAAKHQPCIDCGAQAADWSYDKADPDELKEAVPWGGRVVEIPYSLSPGHYSPRCRPCHGRFDKRKSTMAA